MKITSRLGGQTLALVITYLAPELQHRVSRPLVARCAALMEPPLDLMLAVTERRGLTERTALINAAIE